MPSLSVQYGCGFEGPEGWLNFDGSPTLAFERIPLIGSLYTKNNTRFHKGVRLGNIVTGLPVESNSIDRLFSSHVIEHLAYTDAVRALRNSYLILRPGGVFRLIVPDLGARARRYVEDSARSDPMAAERFLESTLLGERERPRGFMRLMSEFLGGSKHRWMWDEPALMKVLADAGFCQIRRCQFGDSNDPMFDLVEKRDRFIDGDIEELAIECRKPG